jgi:hypothetical protein
MKQNLDVLKTEIQEYLESRDLVVYHGYSRTLDTLPIVMWDTDRYSDYKMFVKAAEAAGVKLLVLHTREFSTEFAGNALEQLEGSDLPPDEHRAMERRLRDMRAYDGFTCAIEISFDLAGRAYIFELRTEWYDEFTDILEDIDSSMVDGDEDEGPIGGYYSKN